MTVLRQLQLVEDWHEGLLLPGEPRQEAIAEKLRDADIVLLLISPDFLAESELYSADFEQTVARHHKSSARVIPILIRPTYTTGAAFDTLKYLPKNRKPVSTWEDRDQAWVEIVRSIREAVESWSFSQAPLPESGRRAEISPTVSGAVALPAARSTWMALGGAGLLAAGLLGMYVLRARSAESTSPVVLPPAPSFSATAHRPALIRIQPGKFMMGCSAGDGQCAPDEARHPVTLTRRYAIFETEVTQGQFHSLMTTDLVHGRTSWGGRCDERGVGDELPMPCTSFLDAVQYANRLSAEERLTPCYEVAGNRVAWPRGLSCSGYRLPTEAEWEYAARAGEDVPFPGGEAAAVGWLALSSEERLHPVKKLQPNRWGLYDMIGNQMEWTWDYAGPSSSEPATDPLGPPDGSKRTYRCSHWRSTQTQARVSCRDSGGPGFRMVNRGFRLVRSLVDKASGTN